MASVTSTRYTFAPKGNSKTASRFPLFLQKIIIKREIFAYHPFSHPDLFHRTVALSGSGIADWTIEVNPLRLFWQQVDFSQIKRTNATTTRVACRELRRLDAKRLFQDSLKFSEGLHIVTVFKPTIESRLAIAPFITENPKTLWAEGRYKQRPILLSFLPVEGGLFAKLIGTPTALSYLNDNLNALAAKGLELKPENVPKVLDYYLNGTMQLTEENGPAILKMVGDRYFYHPLYKTVSQYLEYGDTRTNPIHMIKFAFKSNFSASHAQSETDFGIVHGDDLVYYFKEQSQQPSFSKNTLDAKMSHVLVQTVVSFVQTDSVQMWQSFASCSAAIKTDTCDYQVFQRFEKSDPNRILISVNNRFDLDMVRFWDQIVDNNFQ